MIYDITPLISASLQVWPGDTPPSREVLMDMRRGANLTLSTLRATVHLGAHADAPSHYAAEGPSIEARSLEFYLGECQVLRIPAARGTRLMPEQLGRPVLAPRVLFATGTFPDPAVFNEDFAALSPELIDALAHQDVRPVSATTCRSWKASPSMPSPRGSTS